MKKIFRRSGIVLMILIVILVLMILISYINHRIQLKREDDLYVPIGQQVVVNGHKMNVYTEGDGEITLVFMSGGGTCSPVLDFKSLYSLLSDEYRIAVVEKAGYGFSEDSDIARDIDTVLSETRQALSLAGVTGPFVLCPHSMSGIEALYWAQQYPEEAIAIVGLDMSVPESYENFSNNMFMIKLGAFAARVGITRWIPMNAVSDAITYGTLTEEEKELYKIIFYRGTATTAMLNEVQQIKTSAAHVEEAMIPDLPLLMFSSNGQGTGWEEEQWRGYQSNFTKSLKNSKLINLNCSHYIHDIMYKEIADEMKMFLKGILP